MQKRLKILVVILLIIILSTLAIGCVDKTSGKYLHNVKRFVGDYEMEYPNVFIVLKEKENTYFMGNVVSLTEESYVKYEPRDKKIITIEKKFDKNVVDTINKYISLVGRNITFKKDKIIFNDTNTTLKVDKIIPFILLETKDVAFNDVYYKHNYIDIEKLYFKTNYYGNVNTERRYPTIDIYGNIITTENINLPFNIYFKFREKGEKQYE